MNSCKFWILSTISLFLSINLGLIVWDLIELPYQNPKGLTGPLTLINFNPLNNIIRFVIFLGIPTVVFIIICRLFLIIKDNEKINRILNKTKSYIPNVILIFILFNLLNSFINDFEDYSTLDTFHEGESLTAAFNTISGLGIWKGTHFIHGAFYDPIKAVLAWKTFDNQTVGSFRVINYILNSFLLPFSFYIFILSKYYLNRNNILKIIPLFILVFSLGEDFFNYFNQRDIPVFLVLTLIIYDRVKRSYFFSIAIGFIVISNYLYTIDRGIYLFSALIIYYLIDYFYDRRLNVKNYRIIVFLFSLCLSGLFYYVLLGSDEITYFVKTTIGFYLEKDFFDSYIFPKPSINIFSEFSSLSIYILLFSVLNFVYCLFKIYLKGNNRDFFSIHILVLMLSLFYFRSALGRSDVAHIQYSIGFTFINSFFILAPFLIKYGAKIERYSKSLQLICISIFCFEMISIKFSVKNFVSFNERLDNYVALHDANFLHGYMTLDTVEELRSLFKEEDTVFNYTSEAALPYLFKIKHCGRYYVPWFGTSKNRQEEMINDIKKYKPTYIFYDSNHFANQMDGITKKKRFPILDKFILGQYYPYKKFQNNWWVFTSNKLDSGKISIADVIDLYSDGLYPYISVDVYKDRNILFHHSGHSFRIKSNILLDFYDSNKINFKLGCKPEVFGKFNRTYIQINEISENKNLSTLIKSPIIINEEYEEQDFIINIKRDSEIEFSIIPFAGNNNAWGWFYLSFPP